MKTVDRGSPKAPFNESDEIYMTLQILVMYHALILMHCSFILNILNNVLFSLILVMMKFGGNLKNTSAQC